MEWTQQQGQAIKAALEWYKGGRKTPQVFRLFGYAGTGKTTIAKHIAEEIGMEDVQACAFTGKAALVLTKKGLPAQTLHSLLYKAVQDETTGEVHYKLNPDSILTGKRLLLPDEVSMVGEDLAVDALSFGTKALVLGDPFQLPPVKGQGYFTQAEPDVMLTDIRRQALDDPIIRMSMDVREGRGLAVGDYGQSFVRYRRDTDPTQLGAIVMKADQVLCGLNKTRQAMNARMRHLRGIEDSMPTPGEKLICLKNDKDKGFLNGGMWRVKRSLRNEDSMRLRLESLDMAGVEADADVRREFFTGREGELHWKERKKSDEFTFGNAITVHKSQGSEWDDVIVFDESDTFREDAPRHLYTGITRAAERVGVIL